MSISISRQFFSFLYCSTISGQFASYCSICDNWCVPHNGCTFDIYDPFSYLCSWYLSVTCTPYVYISSSGCNQPPYCLLVYSDGKIVVNPTTMFYLLLLLLLLLLFHLISVKDDLFL